MKTRLTRTCHRRSVCRMVVSFLALLSVEMVVAFLPTCNTGPSPTHLAVSSYWSTGSSSFGGGSNPYGDSNGMWSNNRNPTTTSRRQQCYYKMLGVPISASQADLKQAFRRLVKQYHPDANPDSDTTILFQQINMAYQVLSDPLQRKKYDVRMEYTNDNPHFIISDMEDSSIQRQREQYQQSPFGNLSNDSTGSSWQVNSDGRMFLMDNENDGTLFR